MSCGNENYFQKITECLDIDLTKYDHPNKACDSCLDQINKFHDFKKFCQETDRRLREIFENQHNIIKKVGRQSTIVEIFDCLQTDSENEKKEIKKSWRYKPKRTPTYCNICRIDFKTLEKFSEHSSQEHGIESGLYKCFGCEKRFKNRKTRLGHELKICKNLKNGYRCGICNRYLPRRGLYETHMRDHRGNVPMKLPNDLFKCRKCDKVFDTNDNLSRHVSEHDLNEDNYICEKCGRVFTRKDYLHKHKLTHTGEKQHTCPHCDFRTIQRSSLIVHIRKHTGERPYKCSVCPQRCISSSNLRAHQQRHLGLKVHECTICNKKFGYKISLKEHMSTHAPSSYSCDQCSSTYSRLRGLRRHVLTKHGTRKEGI
ncbi:zinc finger protein 239-like isoform X2 [Danaus plexippus]|nr:zinc finger protein 239-like isoform X2 [Danaus plexippus]